MTEVDPVPFFVRVDTVYLYVCVSAGEGPAAGRYRRVL